MYNHILQNSKYYTPIMWMFLLGTAAVVFCLREVVFKDASVDFYLFSTVVQGFLALVGFLGALVVFKIQLIEDEAQKVSVGLEDSVAMYKGVEVHSYSWIEMMNECSFIEGDSNSQWQVAQIKSGYTKLCKLRDEKSPIRNSMVDFSIITFANIFLALLGIMFSNIFISNHLYFINTLYSFVTIALSFYSIKSAFKVIRASLGYSFSLVM